MMKRRSALPALALMFCSWAVPALAENWKVFEGANGSSQGVWNVTIEGDKISGQAQMATITNGHFGYKFSGVIDADAYSIARTYSSDGLRCNYSGKLSAAGDRIAGSATCNGSTSPWVAIPSPKMQTTAYGN